MRYKWTESELRYFRKPIFESGTNNDWIVLVALAVISLSGAIYGIFTLV